MQTADDIIAALRNPGIPMVYEDIQTCYTLLNARVGRNNALSARAFLPGDKVSFDDRDGTSLTGTVVRVNQKTVTVLVDRVRWKVAGTLLRKVDG